MILLKIKSNRNTKYAKLIKNGHTYSDYLKLQEATSVVSELISRCKDEYQNYIASRLNHFKANIKTYWSALKTFHNSKKIFCFLVYTFK